MRFNKLNDQENAENTFDLKHVRRRAVYMWFSLSLSHRNKKHACEERLHVVYMCVLVCRLHAYVLHAYLPLV